MDLNTTEQLNGKLWTGAKLSAFLCFAVAGGLLVSSLLLPPVAPGTGETGLAASLASAAR
jgi:hypothetical protein